MYPLDRGRWGPTVRIGHLRDALRERVRLDVVAGDRGERRGRLWRYAVGGRLRGLDGIYVENSSTLPSETDVAFLALARALRIPVVTYVRDAQYLFEEYYAATSIRRRVARALFLPAVRLLRAVSSRTGYPSRGLATAVGDPRPDPLLLAPGSPPVVDVPRSPAARSLLFVGGMRYAAHGLDLLVGAVELVRSAGHDVEVVSVSRPGEEPTLPRPEWMRVERAEGDEIHRLLPEVIATIQPRVCTPYNDLAVPIKVMEYLSYGRPLIVTDCAEQARIVREADAGVVADDRHDALAEAILRVLSAEPAQLDAWSANAAAAARTAAWTVRADRIVGLLGEPATR
jgi:glycosyltransferase involved in cell wall biosynthesis